MVTHSVMVYIMLYAQILQFYLFWRPSNFIPCRLVEYTKSSSNHFVPLWSLYIYYETNMHENTGKRMLVDNPVNLLISLFVMAPFDELTVYLM